MVTVVPLESFIAQLYRVPICMCCVGGCRGTNITTGSLVFSSLGSDDEGNGIHGLWAGHFLVHLLML